jgi:hypothetical protein
VASVGVGVFETVVAVQKSRDFEANLACQDDGHGNIFGGPACVQADHDQRVATWAAAIGYSVGGALAIGAVLLHLTEPDAASPPRLARFSCDLRPSLTGATCTARW